MFSLLKYEFETWQKIIVFVDFTSFHFRKLLKSEFDISLWMFMDLIFMIFLKGFYSKYNT